jgi:hypothetical protein
MRDLQSRYRRAIRFDRVKLRATTTLRVLDHGKGSPVKRTVDHTYLDVNLPGLAITLVYGSVTCRLGVLQSMRFALNTGEVPSIRSLASHLNIPPLLRTPHARPP